MTTDTAGRAVETLLDGMHFPEGPRWRDGRLYVSDFFDRHVLAVEPGGLYEVVCEVPGQPSGLGFTAAGDLLVVSMTDRRLLRLDGGELTEVADLGEHAPHHCNDMHVDAAGRAYIGNFGSDVEHDPIVATTLVLVDGDGSVRVAADDIVFPNGVAIMPEGVALVAESFAFRISAFDVADDGSLHDRRVWADFGDGQAADIAAVLASDAIIPDGTCLDAEGGLWVADAGGSGAHRLVDGEIADSVALGDLTAFAVELGGEDGRTLHICAGPPLGQIDPSAERRGALLTCRVDVPGAAWA